MSLPPASLFPAASRNSGLGGSLRRRGQMVSDGRHSFWARLLILEDDCSPVAADDVVVVLLNDGLIMRISSSAFTMRVYLSDVLKVVGIPEVCEIELHTVVRGMECLPGTPVADSVAKSSHSTACGRVDGVDGELQPSRRVYILKTPSRRHVEMLYALQLRLLSRDVRLASEMVSITRRAPRFPHSFQQSLLPADILKAAGLYEVRHLHVTPPAASIPEPQRHSCQSSFMSERLNLDPGVTRGYAVPKARTVDGDGASCFQPVGCRCPLHMQSGDSEAILVPAPTTRPTPLKCTQLSCNGRCRPDVTRGDVVAAHPKEYTTPSMCSLLRIGAHSPGLSVVSADSRLCSVRVAYGPTTKV